MRQKLADLGFQLLREILQLRSEARMQPLACPHELAAKRRQVSAPALLAFHQRCLEERRPLFNQVPGMAIGHAGARGGMGDFSGHADFVQQVEHDLDGLGIVVAPEAPYGFDLDADHSNSPFFPPPVTTYMQSSAEGWISDRSPFAYPIASRIGVLSHISMCQASAHSRFETQNITVTI